MSDIPIKKVKAIYRNETGYVYLEDNWFIKGDFIQLEFQNYGNDIRPIQILEEPKAFSELISGVRYKGYKYKVSRNVIYNIGNYFIKDDKEQDASYHYIKSKGIQIRHTEYKMDFTITTPQPLTEKQKKQLYDLIDSWNE